MIKETRAFTLIELSIVVVIIGLIVAGVVAGQSLVRQAKIRSALAEHSTILTSIAAFKLQYNALPGDLANATSYWSGTANGDGNGTISSSGAAYTEGYRTWQHLALAGLIQGTFTGVAGSGAAPGENIYPSALPSGGWLVLFDPSVQQHNAPINDHNLRLGVSNGTAAHRDILTPSEAFNMDQKLDDGNPADGKILTGSLGTSCTTGAIPNVTYQLSITTIQCVPQFLLPY